MNREPSSADRPTSAPGVSPGGAREAVVIDAATEARVRESFGRQNAMRMVGARMVRVAPGEVEISMAFSAELTQQHGFVHGGVIGMVLDSACGFASLTLMPPQAGILTIEYKLNLLAPGRGERFRFVGRVRKAGRTITLADGEAFAVETGGRERLIATMTATEMTIVGRDDIRS